VSDRPELLLFAMMVVAVWAAVNAGWLSPQMAAGMVIFWVIILAIGFLREP
jgi:uncharacterized ion transporter superfamily protein YfcC